jgi:hypothetical protein
MFEMDESSSNFNENDERTPRPITHVRFPMRQPSRGDL